MALFKKHDGEANVPGATSPTAGHNSGHHGAMLVSVRSNATGPVVDDATSAGVELQAEAELQAYGLEPGYEHRERTASLYRPSSRATNRSRASQREAVFEEPGYEKEIPDYKNGIDPSLAPTLVAEEDLEDKEVEPGWRGWLDVLGTFITNMLCYGMTQSFAVFQQYYAQHLLSSYSTSQISWIGAIQFCLCPLLGCVSGPLFDAGYLKHLLIAGGTIYVLCLMMASLSTEYYQILLSHGLGVGLGMGLIFSPSVSTLPHHFGKSRWRTLAYGCQSSGSAVAGIIFPIILNALLPKVGYAWTMRILGFMVLGLMVAVYFSLSTTVPPRKKIAVLSPTVFRNRAYTVCVAGACMSAQAIYAPLNFSVTYATYMGLSASKANTMPSISNGVSIIGRIIPLLAAQKLGPLNVLCTFVLISALCQFLWTLARNATGITAYIAIYGLVSGGFGASINPSAASFAPETNQAGLYLGMCFFSYSFFWLAGTPISAALIDSRLAYLATSVYGGSVLVVGGLLFILSRIMRSKQVGSKFV